MLRFVFTYLTFFFANMQFHLKRGEKKPKQMESTIKKDIKVVNDNQKIEKFPNIIPQELSQSALW